MTRVPIFGICPGRPGLYDLDVRVVRHGALDSYTLGPKPLNKKILLGLVPITPSRAALLKSSNLFIGVTQDCCRGGIRVTVERNVQERMKN